MLTQVIGIDLGGTAIKLGRFTSDGYCLKSLTVDTPQPATPEAVVAAIVDAVTEVDPQSNAVAIGVGTPVLRMLPDASPKLRSTFLNG